MPFIDWHRAEKSKVKPTLIMDIYLIEAEKRTPQNAPHFITKLIDIYNFLMFDR